MRSGVEQRWRCTFSPVCLLVARMTSPYVPSPTRLRTTYRSMAAPRAPPPGRLGAARQKLVLWAAVWVRGPPGIDPSGPAAPSNRLRAGESPKLPSSGGKQTPAPAQLPLAFDAGPHPR